MIDSPSLCHLVAAATASDFSRLPGLESPGYSHPVASRQTPISQGRALPRRYRNRRIGEFLKELELTEGRSTGIPKILRILKNNGSPLPEFITNNDHDHFLTRFFPVLAQPEILATDQVTTEVTTQNPSEKTSEKLAEPSEKTSEKTSGLGKGLGDGPQSRIFHLLEVNPKMSTAQLSEALAISMTAVDKTLKRLKAKGLLRRIGPLNGGHWQVLPPKEQP